MSEEKLGHTFKFTLGGFNVLQKKKKKKRKKRQPTEYNSDNNNNHYLGSLK